MGKKRVKHLHNSIHRYKTCLSWKELVEGTFRHSGELGQLEDNWLNIVVIISGNQFGVLTGNGL